MPGQPRVVGIVAGGGSLPREIAEHVKAKGGAVHIVSILSAGRPHPLVVRAMKIARHRKAATLAIVVRLAPRLMMHIVKLADRAHACSVKFAIRNTRDFVNAFGVERLGKGIHRRA